MYGHGYHQCTIIPLPPPYLYFGTAYASTLPIVMYVDATFHKVEYECVYMSGVWRKYRSFWTKDGKWCALYTVMATIQLVEVTFMYVTVRLSNSQKIQGQSTMRLLVK